MITDGMYYLRDPLHSLMSNVLLLAHVKQKEPEGPLCAKTPNKSELLSTPWDAHGTHVKFKGKCFNLTLNIGLHLELSYG